MNRLAQEKNPYLSQHAGNPVDWFPWGDEAFAKARKENKPVFLSIGYATCHWCHVMERESFADPKTAEIMNRYFVSVKVDREERPDVDKIYMTAATGVGWGGGWPLSIWMTPEGKPFFGGTYFPPESRWGQPGFAPLMERIGKMWAERGADMSRDAEKVADALRASVPVAGREAKPDPAWLDKAADALAAAYDDKQGGFGGAPKFPM
ncbi:MAG TPA: thioredoxin domain-containing protein, partial [Elusimicrobiota bacterium]|nr:thioredoxin domain-containing protein [Elusimicrobiota bacterium]